MSSSIPSVFSIIAKGGEFSVASLAALLQLSEETIKQQIGQLISNQCTGLQLINGKVCMEKAIEVLSVEQILSSGPFKDPVEIEVFEQLTSSNQYLLDIDNYSKEAKLCAVEYQTAGRGRLGRHWVMPMAGHLSFSIAKVQPLDSEKMMFLSLAAGVCVIESLKMSGLNQLYLKWPNDLVIDLGDDLIKLGGVLVESRYLPNKQVKWVMGIGINIEETHSFATNIKQPVLGILQILSESPNKMSFSRNRFIAEFIKKWQAIESLLDEDPIQIINRWRQFDILNNREVNVFPAKEAPFQAVAKGIDDKGRLRIENQNVIEYLNSGEVKVRIKKA